MNPFSEPITFTPLYQERVWGGRILETNFHRRLPKKDVPYGEAWEVVDRPDEQSVISTGGLKGRSLNELWNEDRDRIFGKAYAAYSDTRFPILMKILDARDRLSVQVHPPAELAVSLGGEPKTEMWYIAEADEGAKLYVGLKRGISQHAFREGIQEGKTEEQVHAIHVKKGQFIFIPSGRLHAIGAGLVIYEIQQNSDTTYRVFDWNRLGLDGKPRTLHVDESLQCIDFSDFEPGMDEAQGELLVDCPHFRVEKWKMIPNESRIALDGDAFALFTVVAGELACGAGLFYPGASFMIPAGSSEALRKLRAGEKGAELLRTSLPLP